MKIACIQSQQRVGPANHKNWDLDRIREAAGTQIDEGFAMMQEAVERGAQFLVTIEAFNWSVHPDDERYDFMQESCEPLDGPLMERFRAFAGKHGVYVVGGLYTARDGKAYNSAILFGPDGHVVGVYDKTHLPAGEDKKITPGNEYPVFETELGKVAMLVCWDMQYPEVARIMALKGADLIALPTWGWELKYGPTRAYENQVTVAAAMGVPYEGRIWDGCDPSCVVDNMGNIIAEGRVDGPCVVVAEVDIRQEPAPQYGSGEITGMSSMRQIRLSQRRPETYGLLTELDPPLTKRYGTLMPKYRR